MTSAVRPPTRLSAARTLPRSTRFALALLLVHILHSGVIATWLVVGMDTRFLVGGYTALQRASWLILGVVLLWSGTWGSTKGILVWYLATGLFALLFVRLLTTRESRDAFRVMVT